MNKAKQKKYPDWNEYLKDKLQNPQQAKIYLETALEEYEKDNDTETFLLALRRVALAQGDFMR